MTGPTVAAVVLGASATALAVVRELARAGLAVALVAAETGPATASRYLHARAVEPDPARRLARLLALGGEENAPPPALIPTSDQDVDFAIAHRAALASRFALQPSHADGSAAAIMDKARFYALCGEHGVAFPALYETTAAGLADFEGRIALPAMVKPAELHPIKDEMAGRKLWIARAPGDLAAIAAQVPARAGTLLAQEIVPGPESLITLACCYRDAAGRVHQAYTARKLRQYPPGFGSAALVQSAPEPESLAIAERLLAAVDYRGIAAAEFKRDPRDGALKIIEINVRPSLWFWAAPAAGRPLCHAAVADLTGRPLPPDRPQRQGVRWRLTLKDMASARYWARASDDVLPPPDPDAVGRPVRTVDAVADWRDPLPLAAELATYARKAWSRR